MIELNTYKGECVLDPFMGSGQTAIACIDTGRHYVGVDVDESYIALAQAAHRRISAPSRARRPSAGDVGRQGDETEDNPEEGRKAGVRARKSRP